MSTPPASSTRVVIVGGGITGLTAAWRLQCAGIGYALLESSGRLGGKLQTDRRDGFVMELGADAILTRKPWALARVPWPAPSLINLASERKANARIDQRSGRPA